MKPKEQKYQIALIALLVCAGSLPALSSSIKWQTLDAGGGTVTGGVYRISGTIGQPDAGNMDGGNFVIRGGFWVPQAVQVGGAPWLNIVAEGGTNVMVWWEPADPGWTLQEALTLRTNWVDSATGTTNPIVIPAIEAAMFYRLRQE